jgi:hypothetical protein
MGVKLEGAEDVVVEEEDFIGFFLLGSWYATVIDFERTMNPFMASKASAASSGLLKETNPYPLDKPVTGLLITRAETIRPYGRKS